MMHAGSFHHLEVSSSFLKPACREKSFHACVIYNITMSVFLLLPFTQTKCQLPFASPEVNIKEHLS